MSENENSKKDNEKKSSHHCNGWCCCGHNKYGFGLIILIIGVLWLMKDLGWISSNISFWPIAFIVFGIYILAKKFSK